MKLRIGTRQSALALAQTELVARTLRARFPCIDVAISKMTTAGDKNLSVALSAFGGKGAFVSEFERALLSGDIDLAVHSAKDMPTKRAAGLEVAMVLPREDARDVLVWRNLTTQQAAFSGAAHAVIGTSSPRRALQLQALLPHCQTKLLRGNVPTRLAKLAAGDYDAIVLAAAGLKRLGLWRDDADGVSAATFADDGVARTASAYDGDATAYLATLVFQPLDYAQLLPAGGQGIIAVECRSDDTDTKRLLAACNDAVTFAQFSVERYLLAKLGTGCHEPTAVFSQFDGADATGAVGVTLYIMEERDGRAFHRRLHGAAGTAESLARGDYHRLFALADALLAPSVGTVYLVGAGAGDDGLLTLRAQELVRRCDVLVYDALVNPAFLHLARADAETRFVGKVSGSHSLSQEDINALLVQYARSGKTVVRLKGGDPFVFGRGGEEAQALSAHGVPYQLVPGVTSAVAVLESAGLPVTHREVARSFTVITGHVAHDDARCAASNTSVASVSGDGNRFSQYASIDGTLVFLMGVAAIPDIAAGLLAGGMSPEMPAAVVEWGTTVRQRRVNATLATLAAVAARERVTNPAVICVGAVAAFDFTSSKLPLSETRVAITGTAQLVAQLAAPLKDLGALVFAAPYLHPSLNVAALSDLPPLSTVGWLVFTSANGVHVFFEHIDAAAIDHRSLSHLRFCVVGRGTAAALRSHGFIADYVPDRYTVADMAQGFVSRYWQSQDGGGSAPGTSADRPDDACRNDVQARDGVRGGKTCTSTLRAADDGARAVSADRGDALVCVLRAADGSPDLAAVFDRAHIPYRDIPLYTVATDRMLCRVLLQQLDVLDYVTFASSGGARVFFEQYAAIRAGGGTLSATHDGAGGGSAFTVPIEDAPPAIRAECTFVCIGAKTAATVRRYCAQLGIANRVRIAGACTAQGLIDAIRRAATEAARR